MGRHGGAHPRRKKPVRTLRRKTQDEYRRGSGQDVAKSGERIAICRCGQGGRPCQLPGHPLAPEV